MHKFSRSLLFAGVAAFGLLTACEGDTIVDGGATGVQSIAVTPPSATINVGESISLAASVTADANTAKTVTWSTSSAATATVDATGKVTGVKAGNVTVTATSTADPSKAAASAITVNAGPVVVNPSIAINSVTQNGNPANLLGAAGQLDVTVNTSGGGLIETFLSTSCTSNTISATDQMVASQQATSAQPGTVTLSFNTAQLTAANAPRFPNGAYCIKTRLTNGATVVVATNTIPLTLANVNAATAALAFTSRTGGPTSAVSTLNGLNYNQGDLTVTITPVIFTSSSPVALISGYFTRNGEQAGGASPGNIAFVNVPVTAGKATIVMTDTALAGVNSIFQYTSLPAGDNLVITSATDAAGNPVSIPGAGVAVAGAQGIRIDNDIPLDAATTYTVTAPNGYIGAAYSFASGTGGTAPSDTRGGVQGVGGVTITYYVGLATSAAFTTANSCTVTGLNVATTGSSLPNTATTNEDKAKVIISDALGNKVCRDVASTFAGGLFGVDKAIPVATASTSNNGAAANTGYDVSKNFSFIYNDTISGFNPTTPLTGTLTRNFFTAGTSAAVDCLIGTYNATAKTCAAAPITVTSTFGTPPNAGGSVEFTNGTATAGYYTISATPVDIAGNVGAVITRVAAYDVTNPAVGTLAQSPNPVAPLATVTVTGTATDNLDLASAKGRLSYATAPWAFPSVSAAAFEANFNSVYNTSQAVSIALPNVYRGLQSVSGTNVIQANTAVPTARIQATDVGTNVDSSAALTIATTTAATNVLSAGSNTLVATPTSAAPATSQATTTLTINVGGLVADPAFQSRPFDKIEIYKLNTTTGELQLVNTIVATSTPPTTTDVGTARTYTYTQAGVALTAAATNTFYVVGVTAAGDAVISNAITVTNP